MKIFFFILTFMFLVFGFCLSIQGQTTLIHQTQEEIPKPTYPACAEAVNARGSVIIQVLIGKDGKVKTATVLLGHPLLRAASKKAAEGARYRPRASESLGIIAYRF
ncbi:MAG TPA: energy transducer TonB [Candidatus Paceibacterota bacterium]|jgi:outer membrane biosynthesis protein TonB|nr:energy transducer TonB [Candidatus Paceibacterota bacterium]